MTGILDSLRLRNIQSANHEYVCVVVLRMESNFHYGMGDRGTGKARGMLTMTTESLPI